MSVTVPIKFTPGELRVLDQLILMLDARSRSDAARVGLLKIARQLSVPDGLIDQAEAERVRARPRRFYRKRVLGVRLP